MVTMVTEMRVLNWREAEAEFDGRWFLLDKRDFPPKDDMGYLVAYGDGTDEDWKALMKICCDKYDDRVFLGKGWVPKDDIFDNGIIDIV
jgi:hypothetical protein